jgi:putative nucleotidyltransferase with HDIG domain
LPAVSAEGLHTDRRVERGERGAAQWIGDSLEAALEARAPGVHASTPMVRRLSDRVGRQLGLEPATLKLIDLGAQVRDVGMLALPDTVVLATAPLSPEHWALINRHPMIGAEMLERLPPAAGAAATVRSHHERWDGDGYPNGERGDQIPLSSRVIAVCDAFASMASDRPHRRGAGAEAALEQVRHERGTQFDPAVVDALIAVLGELEQRTVPASADTGASADTSADTGASAESPDRPPPTSLTATVKGRRALTNAIAEFAVLPAFAPAYDRLLAALEGPERVSGEIVAAVESDIGLTVAIMRRAQDVAGRVPIASITDAIASLGADDVRAAVELVPRAEFPWRTTYIEVLMHGARVHAQAVARAAVRISRESQHADEVVVAALLHDVGKLALSRTDRRYEMTGALRTTTPELRVRQERREYGLDHASLGGLLLGRWGLPKRLVSAVSAHHSAHDDGEVATYVRLADAVVHRTQGDSIDRNTMLRLANACGLNAGALRDLLFDLPHSGGSDRRRAEPTPLSDRETAVLRLLAEGKVYKVIATEIGLAVSTVRTHLHNIYAKMDVGDRAQAVLKATEMGWI